MAVINVQGTISPLWREHVVANPPQTSVISAGGGSGTNTVTVGTGLVGLQPGVIVNFSAGTAEPVNTIVLSYVSGTGVVTFAANLTNAHTSGNLMWGYSGTVYDGGGGPMSGGFGYTSFGGQTPLSPNAQPSTLYSTNPKVRDWQLELRQSNVYS